jgi:two-component system, LytTR family, sensor kinase
MGWLGRWTPTVPRTQALAIIGGVLVVALLDGLHTHAGLLAEGGRRPLLMTLGLSAIFWLTYFAFVPLILFVANRYPLDLARPRTVFIHLGSALAFTYAHIVAIIFLMAPLVQSSDAFLQILGRYLRLTFGINFLTYVVIVGAMYAHRYYTESRQRELAAAQLAASLAAARLEALRAKLDPHFLFNALNAISVLALKRKHKAVVETIARLSDLLRVSLDDTRPQHISLGEELRFIDGYLDLLRLRFGDRMVVERRVAANSLDALVPTMILQPVVENAIMHGVAARCDAGHVAIEAERVGDRLRLRVVDNGPGFAARVSAGLGIGLGNTRARLAQSYGTACSLELSDAVDGGAIVTMTLPFVAAGELPVSA